MVSDVEELVQRVHHYAMVDEVDSVLVDDARTPLIISGPMARGESEVLYTELKPRIARIVEVQKTLCNGYLNEAKKLLAAGNKMTLTRWRPTLQMSSRKSPGHCRRNGIPSASRAIVQQQSWCELRSSPTPVLQDDCNPMTTAQQVLSRRKMAPG